MIELVLDMLLNFTKKHGEEPQVRPIEKYNSDAFVFIDGNRQWSDKYLSAPSDLIANRKISLLAPQITIGRIRNDGKPPSPWMISSDEFLYALRGNIECFHFAVIPLRLRAFLEVSRYRAHAPRALRGDRVLHAREHILELPFKTAIQVGLFGLIHIKVDRKDRVFISLRP
jgi:hypothetical protein